MPERISNDGARAVIHREAPTLDGLRTAAIGGFRCDAAEAGAALLHHACGTLAGEGYGAVLGPMDGDTWHSYRAVTWSDSSAPFLMEPTSGPHDLASFAAAGFRPVAEYLSARQPLEGSGNAAQPDGAGPAITHWDGSDAEALFAEVHALSARAFQGNPFYRPLSLDAFLAIYMPTVPLLRPELLLFSRAPGGALQGYFFAIPDYQQGPEPRDVIFKTYASLVPGVGRLMVARAVRTATGLGYRNAIHALMHADNRSADRSQRLGAAIFRRYALLARRLDG